VEGEMKANQNLACLRLIQHREEVPLYLQCVRARRIAEVGVLDGVNLKSLMVPSLEVAAAIDPYRETGIMSQNDAMSSQAELDRRWEHLLDMAREDPRIHPIREFSPGVAGMFVSEYFDYIYIDADHTEEAVYQDLLAWWPKVAVGGVLAGHDFMAGFRLPCGVQFGVAEAVLRFTQERDLAFHIDAGDCLRIPSFYIPKLGAA
jgi:hypothetical protein